MIRITQQESADGAKRYYAKADYYSEGQEIVGLWGGKAAARLGLSGTVDKSSFEMLCARHRQVDLGRRGGPVEQVGASHRTTRPCSAQSLPATMRS